VLVAASDESRVITGGRIMRDDARITTDTPAVVARAGGGERWSRERVVVRVGCEGGGGDGGCDGSGGLGGSDGGGRPRRARERDRSDRG